MSGKWTERDSVAAATDVRDHSLKYVVIAFAIVEALAILAFLLYTIRR